VAYKNLTLTISLNYFCEMKALANLHPINMVMIRQELSYASYSILRDNYAGMSDNIETTKENSKKPSQRGDNNKSRRAIVSRDIKNRMEDAITKPNVDGDPTRSDE
jgi:hypothetical protein